MEFLMRRHTNLQEVIPMSDPILCFVCGTFWSEHNFNKKLLHSKLRHLKKYGGEYDIDERVFLEGNTT